MCVCVCMWKFIPPIHSFTMVTKRTSFGTPFGTRKFKKEKQVYKFFEMTYIHKRINFNFFSYYCEFFGFTTGVMYIITRSFTRRYHSSINYGWRSYPNRL